MNDFDLERVKRFVKDEATVEAVFNAIRASFLKARAEKDVHYLAAKSLAIEFLEDVRKDLEKYRLEEQKEPKVSKQVGL